MRVSIAWGHPKSSATEFAFQTHTNHTKKVMVYEKTRNHPNVGLSGLCVFEKKMQNKLGGQILGSCKSSQFFRIQKML